MKKIKLCFAGIVVFAAAGLAAEPTVMHCFAFTPVAGATQADWDAWYKATDALPKKISGLKRVWYGKLRRPMQKREYAACMEFENEAAFDKYGPHPEHKAWEAVYGKVREPGTTTYQILPVKK